MPCELFDRVVVRGVVARQPSLISKALLLFAPFGFAGCCGTGYRSDAGARALALGAVLPIAGLAYVQTPERALEMPSS
jgi:hypothetical protein